MAKYGTLFDEYLGVYLHPKVHIEFLPGSGLLHNQFFLVPCACEETSQKELIGILEQYSASEWVCLVSSLPKKMAKS